MKRIGIYGGTFNPPHMAHVKACEAFYRAVLPDELLVMVSFVPPHKNVDSGASTSDRLKMTELAFSELSYVTVSDMEIKRGGKSYTADTLTQLKNDENELYFLCGTDMFLSLDRWYRPDIIFRLATVCYVRRENDQDAAALLNEKVKIYRERFSAKVIEIPLEAIELSSTGVREKLRLGEDCSDVLPKKVFDYVVERNLYK